MQVARIRSQEEYNIYRNKNTDSARFIFEKEKKMSLNKGKKFTIKGFSYPAEAMVNFDVDYNYSDGVNINWRERVVCPVTGLNNRLRSCIHLIDFELGLRPYHNIYISEQVTPLYNYLIKKFTNIIGSEFLGQDFRPGVFNNDGLRHEDATNLSFESEFLDCYMSFECLEHIPNFIKAFSEAFRVLKNGGNFLWSVPFANLSYENIIRAFIDENGQTRHNLEPEYHGDPIGSGGILCFTHFGWQMLDQIKNAGFKDVYAFLYWSDVFGYLGGEQILFIAKK